MWTKSDVGKTCGCCGRKIELAHDEGDFSIVSCSDFCGRSSDVEKAAWKNREKGQFLTGPCFGCGIELQDEYQGAGDWRCTDCCEKDKIRRKDDLLTATYYLLKGRKGQKAQDLAQAIKLELGL